MSNIFSLWGTFILILMVITLIAAVRSTWAGALSLPAMVLLTGIIYFYLLPLLFELSGEKTFFGLDLVGLPSAQIAMALYMVGAIIACAVGSRVLTQHPLKPLLIERLPNKNAYWAILGLLAFVIFVKFYLGLLGFGENRNASVDSELSNLGFLNLAFSALISMTIYTMISTRFGPTSLLLFVVVLGIFLLDGFRFRMVVLCSAAALSWCTYKRFRPGLALVGAAVVAGLVVFNIIGMTRTYGRGIDLAGIQGRGVQELVQAVGGEIGPVFVLSHLTVREPDYLFFEPWYIAATRLIPSFLWPDKPFPDYLKAYPNGFPDPNAIFAGIAGTQQAEFYMQFGWAGLPLLSFGFFMIAVWTIKRLLTLSPAARLAGLSIMPALIGFYAQQRGYAFQIICEYLFTIAPLFLIHIGGKRIVRSTKATNMQSLRPAST